MPLPTLTPQEITQLTKDAAKQQGFADALAAAVPAKAAEAAALAISDGAFKKFFDYYNNDIIAKYDAERKAINGMYIAAPITEADVVGPATIDGSVRTTPSLPATDVIRIAQFDGGPLIQNATYEQQAITDQIPWETHLVSGYTPQPTLNLTTKTASILTSASTTLDLTDASTSFTVAIGDFFVVKTPTDAALVKVTSVTTPVGVPPPYLKTLGIQVITGPVGASLASGSDTQVFSGFTNAERTAKVTTNAWMQGIMNYLIAGLQAAINARLPHLNTQLAALAANQDPQATANITTATTNANTSKTFLTNYLVTTDISNTGLTSLSTERGVRGGQLTTRLTQISAAYTGGAKNYYNERYNLANNRGNTSRGTLRRQKAAEASSGTLTTYAADAGAAANAINDLLGP